MNEKLNILWTTDNVNTALNMIAMYATASKKNGWFSEVNIIIWGGSNALIKENTDVQNAIKTMIEAGVTIQACRVCSERIGTVELLEALNVEVDYMGEPLTEILKTEEKLLTL